jgi:hypothetical protein
MSFSAGVGTTSFTADGGTTCCSAGRGTIYLLGAAQSDILIGGSTPFDEDGDALDAILQVQNCSDDSGFERVSIQAAKTRPWCLFRYHIFIVARLVSSNGKSERFASDESGIPPQAWLPFVLPPG